MRFARGLLALILVACGSEAASAPAATPDASTPAPAPVDAAVEAATAVPDAGAPVADAGPVNVGEIGFGGAIHGTAYPVAVDRPTGAVTKLDAILEGSEAIGCNDVHTFNDVRVRMTCSLSPGSPPFMAADLGLVIESDGTNPARNGQTITFPHHEGFCDLVNVFVKADGNVLQAMAAYAVLE